MAEIEFFLYDLDGVKQRVINIISYELSRDIDAACDGLRLSFCSDNTLNEIQRIEAYCSNDLIFNGLCDTQRESAGEAGVECFVYARSTACILVDNEAMPFIYNSPSTTALFKLNAEDFGFENRLDLLCCNEEYQVSKGTSCFAAINNFVNGLTGKSIIVNAKNQLILPQQDNETCLDGCIISEKRIINRGDALSRLDYRADNRHGYVYHMKSQFFEDKKINASRKLNLSSLPKWQRDFVALNRLKSANCSYNTIEAVLDGCRDFALYSRVSYNSEIFGKTEDYFISSCTMICDKNGERTRLVLNKNIDVREISYVAE